ncbi:MAG: hypothetical protein LBG76_03065 [Treponema sp.]|jgi:rare lipoprotein A (peptidoglycan hydrolase)|nr:hypothetical protein [Treponema sp.]
MKILIFIDLLGFVLLGPCIAQDNETGNARWHVSSNSIQYAAHATIPIGTNIKVTNIASGDWIVLPVGGRIPEDPVLKVDLYLTAGEARKLKMNSSGVTAVRIEKIPRVIATRVARTQLRNFIQTGNAIIGDLEAEAEGFFAAHASLPLGTKVRIMNWSNGKQTVVTITTRNRARTDRIIELSFSAAYALGIRDFAEVTIRTLDN